MNSPTLFFSLFSSFDPVPLPTQAPNSSPVRAPLRYSVLQKREQRKKKSPRQYSFRSLGQARRLPELCRQRRPRPVAGSSSSISSSRRRLLPLVPDRAHVGPLNKHQVPEPEPLERPSPAGPQRCPPRPVEREQPPAEAEDVAWPGPGRALVGARQGERDAGGGVGDAGGGGLDVDGGAALHLAEGGGLACCWVEVGGWRRRWRR